MNRPWQIWLVLAGCVLLAVAAVAWLSFRALESERAELAAQARAGWEENARLALWRIDSAVAALIAQENARPSYVYQTFYPLQNPPADSADSETNDLRLVPSPLLAAEIPQINLHFQVDAQGQFHSPRVPPADWIERAVPRYLSAGAVERDRRRLEKLATFVDLPQLVAKLPATNLPPANSVLANEPPPATNVRALQSAPNAAGDVAQQVAAQQARGANEYQARQQAVSNSYVQSPKTQLPLEQAVVAALVPVWVADQLLLVRRAGGGPAGALQGCWLDWPTIRESLRQSIGDLLPDAQLLPAEPGDTAARAHMMAALPVRLMIGDVPAPALESLSPVRVSLLITWSSLLLATMAVALLIQGVMSLSERRAAFVSAVTHELRTPLTTLRMYAEMLAEGMVPDLANRQHYLETLRTEADRLTHLVDNVLAYARLERGRPGARIVPVPLDELLKRGTERLVARAAQADFQMQIVASPAPTGAKAVADCAAVEQILFNLVDNACKYARSAENRSLELEMLQSAGKAQFRLRDHGPGVAPHERKRLFQPFRKSAVEAAHSAPGVGLGLALCRRLARDMGGDLSLENHQPDGACFVLTLRMADQ